MTRARDVANLIGSGNYSSTTFTATAGQTAFTISHTQGFVQVFMNGLLLDETVDYTSNGTAITLTSGAAAGDEIEVVAYNTFSVGDAINQSAADTRYVNTTGDTMTGALTGTSAGFTGDLNIGNNDASNPLSKLRFGGTQYGAADIRPTDEGGHKVGMAFYTDGTGDTTIDPVLRMTIDNEGRVQMPYQPNISITLSTNNAVNYTSPTAMFATSSVIIDTQVGITHNTSNGRFTVPVAGRYYFSFFTIVNGSSSSYINFTHNGVRKADAYDSVSGGWRTMSCCGIYNMSANDYIEPYNAGVNKDVGDVHGSHHMRFTMHLIG